MKRGQSLSAKGGANESKRNVEEERSNLSGNFSFILPWVSCSILSSTAVAELWKKERSTAERSVRTSYNKNSKILSLFLFDLHKSEPVTGISLQLSANPDASDQKLCKDFLRVFNADLMSAPVVPIDNELWATLQQTRFARAIGRFSPFSTERFIRWLYVVESAASLRYEGHPFSACIFMTKQLNWVQNSRSLDFLEFQSLMRFEDAILKEKWTRALLRDPLIGLVGLSLRGSIIGVATFKSSTAEGVAVAPHEQLIPISSAIVPGTMAFVSSLYGDLYVLFPNGATFVKSQGRWRYFNYLSLASIVQTLVPNGIVRGLIRIVLDLSFEKKGGLIVVLPDSNVIGRLVPDHFDANRANRSLRAFSTGLRIEDESHRRVLKSGAGIDGAIIISSDGKVLDSACMIGEPSLDDCSLVGQAGLQRFAGSRTTAAWNASIYGVAIKVSEDGPVTIFDKGKVILQLG